MNLPLFPYFELFDKGDIVVFKILEDKVESKAEHYYDRNIK